MCDSFRLKAGLLVIRGSIFIFVLADIYLNLRLRLPVCKMLLSLFGYLDRYRHLFR